MQAPLFVELFQCFPDLTTGELLHYFFQRWVFLPHDFIKARYPESSFLELLVRRTGFYGLMLANVAHQQHPVMLSEAMEKLVHLLRTSQTRFIQNIEPHLSIVWFAACQMPLQRARPNARFGEFLRRARCGGKTLNPVAFLFSSLADRGQ